MGPKAVSRLYRITLEEVEKDMLAQIGRVLRVSSSRPMYGQTLIAFFRLVIEYAEANPGSDFSLTICNRVLTIQQQPKRKYIRRSPAPIRELKPCVPPRLAEHYTLEEAHIEALRVEANRLLKEANRAKRRKRLSSAS